MRFSINLPKILYLTLLISNFAKNEKYYNTNDLIKIANALKPELVRLRKDKNDYKFLDDTNFGGLRGNFSTVLTFRGFINRNNKYIAYYGLGNNDRLFNSFKKGEIILDSQKYCAYTNKIELKKLLEKEVNNFNIRESQSHIKIFLEKNEGFPLKRDNINFPKIAVLKSENNQYFLRILFNTFKTDNIVEFNMFNYLKGYKIKQFNINPLFVIPSYENSWDEFYVVDSKEILINTPLLMYFDKKARKFYDNNNNIYAYYTLDDALDKIQNQDGNIDERLAYNWKKVREQLVSDSVERALEVQEEESSLFIKHFLKKVDGKLFSIYDKDVVKFIVSSSGGPDVILTFSGGTSQKLELEHKWENYIRHRHYTSQAWKDAWLYADEKWDFDKIVQIFSPYLSKYINSIPKVFLCTNKQTGEKEAYEIDWSNLTYKEIEITD